MSALRTSAAAVFFEGLYLKILLELGIVTSLCITVTLGQRLRQTVLAYGSPQCVGNH